MTPKWLLDVDYSKLETLAMAEWIGRGEATRIAPDHFKCNSVTGPQIFAALSKMLGEQFGSYKRLQLMADTHENNN